VPATTVDPLARWHHPHYVSDTPGTGFYAGTFTITYQQFTGSEPKPERPAASWDDPALTHEDQRRLSDEYRAMLIGWGRARFTAQARTALRAAEPVWKAYLLARKGMEAQFTAFWDLADPEWNSAALKLADAHRVTVQAAEAWDETAEGLAELDHEHLATVGEEHTLTFDGVATEIGLDVGEWFISYDLDEYRNRWGRPTPLVGKVSEEIEQQKRRLKEATGLVGRGD